MKRILRVEFSRAFKNKMFWLVAILAAISFTYGANRVISNQDDALGGSLSIWHAILYQGSYGFFAALAAGLPYAASLLADREHNFIAAALMRSRWRDYFAAKILANFCAGMVAVVVPAGILMAICTFFFPGKEQLIPNISWGVSVIFSPGVVGPNNFITPSVFGYTLIGLAAPALFGGLYASFGMAVSLFVDNPFAAMGSPFVLYSLGYFVIFTSRNFNWFNSTEAALIVNDSLVLPVIQYLALAIFFTVCLLAFGKKERLLSRIEERI